MAVRQMVFILAIGLLSACASKTGPYSTVHFKYDQSNLDENARQSANETAEAMKLDQSSKVTIEGHCDERGSNEYNIALGERRAKSVYDYLSTIGISSKRLQIRSWGEERPIDSNSVETAYQKNRRAEFLKQGSETSVATSGGKVRD